MFLANLQKALFGHQIQVQSGQLLMLIEPTNYRLTRLRNEPWRCSARAVDIWLRFDPGVARRYNVAMDIKALEAEGLFLPSDERASLAHRLLMSMEDISEADFDRLWADESARRAASVDAGATRGIPANVVAEKARARLL
jgi:hypothetical protein